MLRRSDLHASVTADHFNDGWSCWVQHFELFLECPLNISCLLSNGLDD